MKQPEEQPIMQQVGEFLDQLGWSYEDVSETMLRTHYHGQFGVEKVMVHHLDDSLVVAINPVLQQPAGG